MAVEWWMMKESDGRDCVEEEMKAWVTFENMEVRFYYILIRTTQAVATRVKIKITITLNRKDKRL